MDRAFALRADAAGGQRGEERAHEIGEALRIIDVAEGLQCCGIARTEELHRSGVQIGHFDELETGGERIGVLAQIGVEILDAGGLQLVDVGLQRRDVAFDQRDRRRLEQHLVALLAVARRLLGAPPRRAVHAERQQLARLAAGVAQYAIAPGDPQAAAVAAHVLVLVVDVLLGLREQLVDHPRQVAAAGVGSGNDRADDRAAEQIVERVAEQLETEIVQEGDAALHIPAQHDGVGVLHELAKAELIGTHARAQLGAAFWRARPSPPPRVLGAHPTS